MSTPEQRAANRAKVKRYWQNHPEYRIRNRSEWHEKQSPVGAYRTFELADPRDPEQLPCLIGFGLVKTVPIWKPFWDVRLLSHSKWAFWLRDLERAGLVPVERTQWSLGKFLPLSAVLSHDLVQIRLREINEKTTGDPNTPPPWSLRNMEALKNGPVIRVAVACLRPDGSVSRYASVGEAAKANDIHTEVSLRRWVWLIGYDPKGNLWFDD